MKILNITLWSLLIVYTLLIIIGDVSGNAPVSMGQMVYLVIMWASMIISGD